MEEAEFKKRYTRENTEKMAVQCIFCGYIDEVAVRFSDGMTCPSCGRMVRPVGYLKDARRGAGQKSHTQHEAAEQEALFRWALFVSAYFPEIDLLYHIPNGGSRNKLEAAHLKRQGVKAGVPDLCLPVARGGYHGLYIELKAGNNKTTEKQDEWLQNLRTQNYAAEVCFGWEQAAIVIKKYLELGGKTDKRVISALEKGKEDGQEIFEQPD